MPFPTIWTFKILSALAVCKFPQPSSVRLVEFGSIFFPSRHAVFVSLVLSVSGLVLRSSLLVCVTTPLWPVVTLFNQLGVFALPQPLVLLLFQGFASLSRRFFRSLLSVVQLPSLVCLVLADFPPPAVGLERLAVFLVVRQCSW